MTSLSVVIPFFNAERWLRTPIESVLGQNHPAEIILVDDGSTDGSVAIAESYGDRVRALRQKNAGVAAARNTGLAAASCDYVLFLDADDYFDGPLISGVAAVADRNRPDLVFSPGAGETGRRRYVHPHSAKWPRMDRIAIATDVANGRTTPVNAQAWRREYLVGLGGFRPDVLLREDTELLLRALLSGAALGFNGEGFAIWVVRPREASKSKRRDEASLASTLAWHRDHVASLPVRQHVSLLRAYAMRSYGVAGIAFEDGFGALGREALALARECGLEGHPGSRAHRMIAAAIGLERKVRIARAWRGMRKAVGLARRPPQRSAAAN